MNIVKAKAPSRVDFAGGTLDIPLFAKTEGGVTLNCAVKKYGHAAIYPIKQNATIIHSVDYDSTIVIKDRKIKYDGKIDLLKAALKRTNFFKNARITIRHDMPPHSRLGTSSSIGVAFIAAIRKFNGEKIDRMSIADLATKLEIEELKLRNGPQDQYAAALGGINFLKFNGRGVKVEKPKLGKDIIKELEKNMILCYVGQANVSGDINRRVINGYVNGNSRIVNALHNIKDITIEMKKQLIKGNTKEFAFLLNEESLNRQQLDKDISKGLTRFIKKGLNEGAIAAKILGAGCGGTLLFYAADNQMPRLANALRKMNAKVYKFEFDFEGVKAWIN